MSGQYKKKIFKKILCGLLLVSFFLPLHTALGARKEGGERRGESLHLQNSSVTILKNRDYFPVLKDTVDKAKSEIVLSFFRFKTKGKNDTYPDVIMASLGAAAKRGVKVVVLLEQSKNVAESTDRENRETLGRLKKMGVNVYLDSPGRTTHTKLAVVDGNYTFIGSHNLTQAALKYNNEISVLIESPQIAAETLDYVKKLLP